MLRIRTKHEEPRGAYGKEEGERKEYRRDPDANP